MNIKFDKMRMAKETKMRKCSDGRMPVCCGILDIDIYLFIYLLKS